jgi:hypothetical protein
MIFFNRNALENNSCLSKTVKSTSAETNGVSNLNSPCIGVPSIPNCCLFNTI